MLELKNKTTITIILLLSTVILLIAFFIQYILGHAPCNLCLIERIPYLLAIIIIPVGLFNKKFEKIVFLFLGLIFLAGTILSFYHFGIEQGFFSESLVCNASLENANLSKDDLLKELQKNQISCKDVSFKIVGLSLATINTIISLLLSVITIKLFLNHEKNK